MVPVALVGERIFLLGFPGGQFSPAAPSAPLSGSPYQDLQTSSSQSAACGRAAGASQESLSDMQAIWLCPRPG